MALRSQSLFLYGLQVTANNRSIDFKTSLLGSEKQATLRLGYYSLTGLMDEVVRALTEADPVNTYSMTANRTFAGGTENRTTISTSGSYLDLLFLSGTRNATSCDSLIGFNHADYTGSTSYIGSFSCGTVLIPDLVGYNYLGPEFERKVFGSVNIAANGAKESIVFQVQRFFEVEFKYEQQDKIISEWMPFMNWSIQQRPLEFTPEITTPGTFYDCTLESTSDDGKALGYKFKEMLPQFPFHYQTGLLKFRQTVPPAGFI